MSWMTKIKSAADVRKDFDEQILMIGYDGNRGRGHPKMTVLGSGYRRQIDRNVAVEVIGALMASYKLKGITVEMPLGVRLLEQTGKEQWAAQQLGRLMRFNPNVKDENPVEAFRKACGLLLPIGKKGKLVVSITTDGAGPMFTRSFRDMGLATGAKQARHADLKNKITERYLAVVAGTDKTVEDAYTEYCETFTLPKTANS